ncbi:hypothetical protein AAII07_56905 [Microvirga sp. 0TCS3.31]
MSRRRSSSTPIRVEFGPMHRGQVLVASRQVVEIDGEAIPLRLLTIEAGRPGGGRPASRRTRRNSSAPRKV